MATGKLGIDLDGLDIKGTVDAAYFRENTKVPGSILSIPTIGSSNKIESTEEENLTNENIDDEESTDIIIVEDQKFNVTVSLPQALLN